MMFRKMIFAVTVMSALLLGACGTATPQATGQLKVVATFSILGDLVKNVGGDKIDLRVLVGPDADTHTFEPSPTDGTALVNASLIFENGLGFERWLDDLYTASGSKAERVVVTPGITPGVIAIGDEAGEIDPHAWQDVTFTIGMVNIIRDALMKADAANADTYQANATAYIQQLNDLDQYITSQMNVIPAERRKLVTNHDALGYFAKHYGFEIIGSALGTLSTEAGDPSAAQLARLIEEVKGAGVPTIFTENVENSKVIEQVASEAGVVVGQPLYTDALGQQGTDGDTYVKMMRHNIDAIVAGLR
jgi:zinc/manganese transport system substrate-binding protein